MARQPSVFGGSVQSLADIYERANERMAGVVADAVDAGRAGGTVAIHGSFKSGIDRELKWLRGQNEEWTRTNIPRVYAGQIRATAAQVKRAGIPVPTTIIGQSSIHVDAVNILANNLLTALDGNSALLERNGAKILEDSILSAATIGRRGSPLAEQTDIQRLVATSLGFRFDRDASGQFRSGALEAITEGVLQGQGADRIKTRMVELFQERGMPAFVDRAGKVWTLDGYAAMVARTTLRETATEASRRGLLEVGLDVVIVIGTSTYPDSPCIPFQDQKLSLTGKTPGFTTLAQAQSDGFLHPNCIHTIGADPDQEPRRDLTDRDITRSSEQSAVAPFQPPAASSSAPSSTPRIEVSTSFAPDPSMRRTDSRVPSGSPVGTSFKVLPGVLSKRILQTAHVIDTVHGDGPLPKIQVRTSIDKSTLGAYSTGPMGVRIRVSRYGNHPELTMAHETGHFIDDRGIGTPGVFASASDALLQEWRDAVDASDSVNELKALMTKKSVPALLTNGATVMRMIDHDHVEYLLSRHELFARSYAQYVANRSGHAVLLGQLEGILNDTSNPYRLRQWSNHDFDAIARAIDNLMVKLGWLK